MRKENSIGLIIGIIIIVASVVLLGWIFLKGMKSSDDAENNVLNKIKSSSLNLGDLCSGEQNCKTFCSTNQDRCNEYCLQDPNNQLCKELFKPSSREPEEKQIPQKNQTPILKNLGVTIEPWNKQTNLAGDLLFSKKLLFDDGHVSNDKVFIDFGHKEKYRPNDIGSIEYWFYVPLKTKVRAPIDGIVEVAFFNHTKDWGVNIRTDNTEWFASFEHLVNLIVKNGDIIKAGDIVGEAAPRTTFKNEIAMVELAVWTGGKGIVKYCPFNYLDESLKPMYKEKLENVANDWETFIGRDVYQQDKWVAPGCLVENIIEK